MNRHVSRRMSRRASKENIIESGALAELRKKHAEVLESKPSPFARFIIHPGNRFKSCYDIFIVACVTWSSIAAPLEVAYRIEVCDARDIAAPTHQPKTVSVPGVCSSSLPHHERPCAIDIRGC